MLGHLAERGERAEFLALKHESSILGHSSNPVCGFSMIEQIRRCAVWPMGSWLDSSLNHCPRILLSCFRVRTSARELLPLLASHSSESFVSKHDALFESTKEHSYLSRFLEHSSPQIKVFEGITGVQYSAKS